MSLKWDNWKPADLHQEEEVEAFTKIAQAVYEKDIRRKFDG
jgi:hypothetical protein